MIRYSMSSCLARSATDGYLHRAFTTSITLQNQAAGRVVAAAGAGR